MTEINVPAISPPDKPLTVEEFTTWCDGSADDESVLKLGPEDEKMFRMLLNCDNKVRWPGGKISGEVELASTSFSLPFPLVGE